ncbi:multifunctional transcriptional regulator/nicotinamide-nucleotide adenylyltransferase/ribosylnicotinamide kinase NadR [Thermococci archaeon]|nr:MAG: multifunctional transcriptional regulator/nicotinamide-nucleotide adenylyltransferase/ribosylnicotinamide kinase NadR [Thermococci archaeon]
MYKIGAVPGKFFPAHRGHLYQIIQAATKCELLYVVVSDNEDLSLEKCRKDNLPYIPLKTRALWLSMELQNVSHIKVVQLDETGIPAYPDGSVQWCKMLLDLIPDLEIIFGGEQEYEHTYMKNMPGVKYEVYDYARSRYPVSGTEVRNDYLKHWDYILGTARPFFARRILVAGTESCGKTTLVKYLGKIFHTSWSEEYGRYYSRDCLGGNEDLFSIEDFERIAEKQRRWDEKALRGANRITFFDSDAVITQYYCELYMGQPNPKLEAYVDPQKYDVVLLLAPTVKWVPDGLRSKGGDGLRCRLHKKLLYMYYDRGFKDKIIEIADPDYATRLQRAVSISDMLLGDRHFKSRY